METAALYVNAKGQNVTHSSYSSRQTFKHCPREFQLTRIQGWREKGQRAAPMFGRCIEAGLQTYEESARVPGKGIETFTRLWNDVKTLPDFPQWIYTETEGNWESLQRAGREMMRLYEIRAPYLPIAQPRFQQVLQKKLFPGTELDILENKAIFDMLSFPAWNHKLLPAIPENESATGRPLIIDIKTSGEDLDIELVGLDPQLAEYAWQARIPDIAFLWFVKRTHGVKKGSRVTLLQERGGFHAGFELLVLAAGEKDDLYLGTYATLEKYDAALKGLRSKARDSAECAFIAVGIVAGEVAHVDTTDVTKQRLQFGAARLSDEDMNDIGRDVAQTTVEMVRAHKEGYYPKLAGVRFPNKKCNFCALRWICLNKPEKRDQNLTRKGEEWLDGDFE